MNWQFDSRWCVALTCVVVAGMMACNLPSTKAASTGKTLIELGWDQPKPAALRQNRAQFEASGFQGVVIGPSFGTEVFNKTAYPESSVLADINDLQAARSPRLTEHFLRMNSRLEPGWDWFSDADWAATQTNVRNFARLVKAGGFRGVLFDTEPYGQNPWAYSKTLFAGKSFADVGKQVRSRGAAFMRALQAEVPNVRVLCLYFVASVRDDVEAGELEQSGNALLLAFADGMLDAINPNAEIIDGNETTYYNTNPQEFDDKVRFIRESARLVSAENRVKYERQVRVANAVYVDGVLNLWRSPRFFGYYLSNDTERLQLLEHNVYHGLRSSEGLVLVYSENMDWWGTKGEGVKVPAGLAKAIKHAADKHGRGAALGFDLSGAVSAAMQKFNARVEVGGTVRGNGKSVNGLQVRSGIEYNGDEVACVTWGESGDTIRYGCTLPGPSWSGTITPKLDGVLFDPPSRTYSGLAKNRWAEDFIIRP